MRNVFASAQFESVYFSTILQLKTTQSEVRKSNIYYFCVLRPSETTGYSENSWMHPSTSTMPLVHPASEHSNWEGNDEARSGLEIEISISGVRDKVGHIAADHH